VSSFLLVNWYFTPPLHTLSIDDPEHLISIVVFLAVAGSIGWYASVAARRSLESQRARSEAETLAAMAGAMGSSAPLDRLVGQVRSAFEARAVAVLVLEPDGRWRTAAAAGPNPPASPDAAEASATLGEGAVLAIDGGERHDLGSSVFAAFCVNLGAALERDRLDEEAARADRLAEAERLRSGLLSAVSHDLRTPLTAIKAAASTLLQPGNSWPEDVRTELLRDIDGQVDRLTSLVENLLTMSRIQAGAVRLELVPTDVADIAASALSLVDRRGREVRVDLDDAPLVIADPDLLERVLGNLVDNACKWSPEGEPVTVDADPSGGSLTLRVADRGPGIPRERRAAAFAPFQRLGDRSGVEGIGLGLAIAAGFVEAMGGQIEIDDTPGGGTTMLVSLPLASTDRPVEAPAAPAVPA
jgi:two-component system sensor histidine kinase KdpD